MSRLHYKKPIDGRIAHGFTLTEVLVSIGIIGLLLAVTIPAVQHVRDATRRVECFNHLAQIGKALSNFESQYGRLPAGPPGYKADALIEHGSPQVYLLPFLEQKPLYDRFKAGGFPVGPQADPQLFTNPDLDLPLWRCPSDDEHQGTNYRFNTGSHVLNFAAQSQKLPYGPMGLLPGRSMAQITDGASNTAIVSESLMGNPDRGSFDPQADSWMGGLGSLPVSTLQSNASIVSLCTLAAGNPVPRYPFSGWHWTIPGIESALYNHVVGPNSSVINCNSVTLSPMGVYNVEAQLGIQKASSRHSGGVNVLLLDGSVHFANESIDLNVWRAYGSCAAGDQVVGFGS